MFNVFFTDLLLILNFSGMIWKIKFYFHSWEILFLLNSQFFSEYYLKHYKKPPGIINYPTFKEEIKSMKCWSDMLDVRITCPATAAK